jgi:hypothetical protein
MGNGTSKDGTLSLSPSQRTPYYSLNLNPQVQVRRSAYKCLLLTAGPYFGCCQLPPVTYVVACGFF